MNGRLTKRRARSLHRSHVRPPLVRPAASGQFSSTRECPLTVSLQSADLTAVCPAERPVGQQEGSELSVRTGRDGELPGEEQAGLHHPQSRGQS